MQTLRNVTPAFEVGCALEELTYCAGQLAKWATTARTIRTYADPDYGVGYINLVQQEMERLNQQHARLLAALNAASVQLVTRETNEAAA